MFLTKGSRVIHLSSEGEGEGHRRGSSTGEENGGSTGESTGGTTQRRRVLSPPPIHIWARPYVTHLRRYYAFGRVRNTNRPKTISPHTHNAKMKTAAPIPVPTEYAACSASDIAAMFALSSHSAHRSSHHTIKILKQINTHLNNLPTKLRLNSLNCTPHFGHFSGVTHLGVHSGQSIKAIAHFLVQSISIYLTNRRKPK